MNNHIAVDQLVTIKELAQIMNVPVSWLYSRTRYDAVPCVRFGKYIRFNPSDVMTFFRSQKSD